MALADLILKYVPLPSVPRHYTSYVPGKTPLSTPVQVIPALAAYLVVIFSVRAYMKDKQPKKLQFLFQVHNIFLSLGSLLLLTLIMEEVAPMVWKHGLFWGMCHEGMWTSVRIDASLYRLQCLTWQLYRDSNSIIWSTIHSSTLNYWIPFSLLWRKSLLVRFLC